MIKYICPYCAEQEDFIFYDEYRDEYGIEHHARRVRCGTCYQVFNDGSARQLSDKGYVLLAEKENIKTTKNLLKIDGLYLFSRDFWRGMRCKIRHPNDTQSAANYFHAAYIEFPNKWNTIFYDAVYSAKTNSAIQNITYYKIFATKIATALHVAANEFSGEELKTIVDEIVEESMYTCQVFESSFCHIAEEYLEGKYEDALRPLVSMDVSIIYDVLGEFLSRDEMFFEIAYNTLEDLKIPCIDFFGQTKKAYIDIILRQNSRKNWNYPICYGLYLDDNKSFEDIIKINKA